MAKDDFFRLVYIILKELYECKKQGCRVDADAISAERFGIPESYLLDILYELLKKGYIRGVLMRETKGGGKYAVAGLEDIDITIDGIEYLQENSMMKKVYNALKDLKNIAPGI